MPYGLPGDMNTTVDVFSWANGVVDGWFFPSILIAVYVIILAKMLFNPSNSAAKAFSAASFMVMILSIFARVLDFVSTSFMNVFIILTAIGGIWMHVENKG